jgi:deoxyribonuclease V
LVWPRSPDELIAAQHALARAAPTCPPAGLSIASHETSAGLAGAPPVAWQPTRDPSAIGGCAVVFPRGQGGRGARGDPAWAAAAVLRGGRVVADATVRGEAAGPYLPGLLALREGPCLEAAVRALRITPDVLLVDATGRDHPRRAGLAVHLGAITGLATVGVTHRPLLATGTWPADERGARSPLVLDGACVGAWLRTRRGARPLAIHPGWHTTLEVAIEVVLSATHGHRTPEPLRHARRLARVARAGT